MIIDIYSYSTKQFVPLNFDPNINFFELEEILNKNYNIKRIVCSGKTIPKESYSISIFEYSKDGKLSVLVQ